MSSVIYRDRERDRFEDSRTTISTARRSDERGGYTTTKRYVIKGEDDTRSSFGGGSRVRPAERVEETRIVRREVDVEEPPRRYERREERREDPRSSERELVIRRDRVEEEPRRDYGRRDDRTEERELVIRRTTEREEPSRERELTISRSNDRRDDRFDLDIRRGDYGDRDLQRYNRTTEYFQPAQPQTIVIRNEIVMPRGRDDEFDNIRRSEADEEKTVVKREPSGGRGEEFFYEKKVRERIEEPARYNDDYDDRRSRREISPHDSVSQVGRRDRGYSSDDSMVYVRHKVTEDEGYDGSRSPRHKRHLAEGVIAGIGAAEILRHHKQKEGREPSGGISRVGRDVGAGALGALAVEGVTRARSAYRERSKSRRRSRSDSRDRGGRSRAGSRSRGGGRGRDRSRSRSESASGAKKLAGLGLGAAAIAAAAIYAQKRNKEKSQSPSGRGRSSSRRRASSVPASEADDARNPSHRNKIMAEAGAAGAVLAALVERQRSKSRGGRDRSRSKVRQALPVIAAGLGSAGIAALYEKNKAKKETEAAATAERRASRSRSRSRSRGRGRSADPYYDGPRGAAMSDPNLIEYGEGNVYGNNYGADYYGQPPPGDSYYNNHQNAVVPAVAAAGAYGASREARPSRSRSPSSQDSSDDGGRRRRRHRRKRGSRSRSAGKEAAAAVGGVAAASEYERAKQERRDRKARKRQEQQGGYGQDPYEDPYNPQQQQQYNHAPQPPNDPYAAQTGFYPQSQQFPPPPGAAPPQFQTSAPVTAYAPEAAFNPNDYPPPPGAAPAPYAGHFASGGNADPYALRGRGADENVSAAPTFGNPFQYQNHSVPDGLNREHSAPTFSPPPLINIQPDSVSSANPQKSNPFLPVPNPFSTPVPPPQLYYPASTPRSTSQPPPHRKSVAFAEAPDVAGNTSSTTIASSQQSGHHRHVDATRGYEAGDDTDSTIDAQRSNHDTVRSQAQPVNAASAAAASSLDPRNGRNRQHSRRRSADPTAATRSVPVKNSGPDPAASPAPSDETIDLPERFDKNGRKKPQAGDDPVADRLDNILAGKGAAGKLFGNFVDGLFGPEGRKKKGN